MLVAACSVAPPVPAERTSDKEPVRTAQAQRGDISGVLSLSGEIRPKGRQTLTARVSGRVAQLEAATAQATTQADAALAAARARVDQLQRDPNSASSAATPSTSAGQALADARQTLRQAEDNAAQARRSGPAEELSRARQD